jgi:hypothetical protein
MQVNILNFYVYIYLLRLLRAHKNTITWKHYQCEWRGEASKTSFAQGANHPRGDQKAMQLIPDTCSIRQKINYIKIRKQKKTMLY